MVPEGGEAGPETGEHTGNCWEASMNDWIPVVAALAGAAIGGAIAAYMNY